MSSSPSPLPEQPSRSIDLKRRLEGLTDLRTALLVAGILLPIFLATASWSLPYHRDPLTNVVTSWYVAHDLSVVWTDYAGLDWIGDEELPVWVVPSTRGPVGQYPPGTALAMAPFYALVPRHRLVETPVEVTLPSTPDEKTDLTLFLPPLAPAAIFSAFTTALAFGLLAVAGAACVSRTEAVFGALIGALGTSAWAVASAAPFQHGPAMMWMAAGLVAASRQRWATYGAMMGLAILTRPPVAVIPAVVGVGLLVTHRRWRPFLAVAATSSLGVAALFVFNWRVFDTWSVSGGYGTYFTDQFVGNGLGWTIGNVLGGLVDPFRGVLTASPFIVLLLLGVRRARLQMPAWVAHSALGGALYLLVVWRSNRFSGGDAHWSYRYPLEALMAAAPLLMAGYHHWVDRSGLRRRVFRATVVAAIAFQFAGAVLVG